GEREPAEYCAGAAGGRRVVDGKKTSATACTSDGNPCTLDQCNGTSVDCQHPAGNGGATCRTGSGDLCDPDEVCTGTSATCPADAIGSGTCRGRAAGGGGDRAV